MNGSCVSRDSFEAGIDPVDADLSICGLHPEQQASRLFMRWHSHLARIAPDQESFDDVAQ
jgi:hypothetical protein